MQHLDIQVITWNVATQFPSGDDLGGLLGDARPDLLLLGLQEVKSQPQNLASDLWTGEDQWTAGLRASLAPRGYIKVRTIRLLGIVLSLFSLAKHVAHIRGLETQFTRLGMGGYWGNKGCVSVRWSVYGVSVCVLNCHLAAHVHMNKDRIDGYNTVLGSHLYTNKDTEMILYHDYIIWMGDLNFRLEIDTEDISNEGIVSRISKKELSQLLSLDQLNSARANGDAFSELDEEEPKFAPTYKFRLGTSEYDLKRAPAWCDRVLYKANVGNYDLFPLSLEPETYSSLDTFTQSDHKPVTANYKMAVFSPSAAADLLLPCYNPVVKFVDAGPYFVSEDLTLVYTVTVENRRHLSNWDWIGLFRAECTNLEDHITYAWSSTRLVRNGAYEVIFGGEEILGPGQYRAVYFSTEARDILGYSDPFSVSLRQFETELELGVEAREGDEL